MKVKMCLGIFLLLAFLIIGFFTLPWLAIFIGIQLQPNPPEPEITYGEFPFRLVYEINGERKVIEDTLICEYDGIGMNEGQGKYRKWKERLASGNENILLLKVNNTQEIYYNSGPADYYMGDMGEGVTYSHNFPHACQYKKYANGNSSYVTISADELFKNYNIKLISWDFTKPIKNNFLKTKK